MVEGGGCIIRDLVDTVAIYSSVVAAAPSFFVYGVVQKL